MAFLNKGRKQDLRVVCEEMGEVPPPNATIAELKKIILSSKEYEEEFVKDLLGSVAEQREERETREKEERKEEKEREAREEREEREREREHKLKMQELEERLRRMKERSREEGSARESGDGSSGKGRYAASCMRIMQKAVHKTPDRAEEWPFYFRHAEMMFERYGVPEQFRGLIIWSLLARGKAKGLYLPLGEDMSNYEATKQRVLVEYRYLASLRRRRFHAGNGRCIEQQQKEWEERMEQKWELGKRVQKEETERSEGKVTGEMRKQSRDNEGEKTVSSGMESRMERGEASRARKANAGKLKTDEWPIVCEISGNKSPGGAFGSEDESLVFEPGKSDEGTLGKFRGEILPSIGVDSSEPGYSQLQPVRMEQENNGADCLPVKEQASDDCSSVSYGIVGVEARGGSVREIPVSQAEEMVYQEADTDPDRKGSTCTVAGDLKAKCLAMTARDQAEEAAYQGTAVLRTGRESFEEKRALCLESEIVRDDGITLVGRNAQAGEGNCPGVIRESVAKAESPVSKTGGEKSRNNPGGSHVAMLYDARKPEGEEKQKGRASQVNREEEVALQRKIGDRKLGGKGSADREGSKVRLGNRVRVIFEGKERNATRAFRENWKTRGAKRRRWRNRVLHPSRAKRGSYVRDKKRMKPRTSHMGIMKKLRSRQRFWMGIVTPGLKGAEIFWRGNAREFGKLGFRDKPI